MRSLAMSVVAVAVFGSILVVGCKSESAKAAILAEYCEQGDVDGVMDALEDGADPNGKSGDLGAPLFNALDGGYFTIAGILWRRGADVDIEMSSGKTLAQTFTAMRTDQMNQVDEARLEMVIDWIRRVREE